MTGFLGPRLVQIRVIGKTGPRCELPRANVGDGGSQRLGARAGGPGAVSDEIKPEEAHEIVDLGRRTLPVLGGKAVEITVGGLRSE
jgi:hypothetical protein